jgi:hypothetical protein
VDTGTLYSSVAMFVLGLGLGGVMQVLVIAVQNAVDYRDLGVATSGATLFRLIGGSLGTAILGAIFANRLAHELASKLPASRAARGLSSGQVNPAQLKNLPAPVRDGYVHSFTQSLSTVFLIASAVVAVAFLLAWLLEERPLRRTIEDTDLGDAFAAPQDTDSLREITRELSRMVGRERTRRFIEGVTEHAEMDLPPAEVWLLGRATDGTIPEDALGAGDAEDQRQLAAGAEGLRGRGLVDGSLALTADGQAARERLLVARQDRLTVLVADWEPESPELDTAIKRLAAELDVPVEIGDPQLS